MKKDWINYHKQKLIWEHFHAHQSVPCRKVHSILHGQPEVSLFHSPSWQAHLSIRQFLCAALLSKQAFLPFHCTQFPWSPYFCEGYFSSVTGETSPVQLNEEIMNWCLTSYHLGVSKNVCYFRIYINCQVPLLKHNFLSFGQHILDEYIESIMFQGIS